MIHISDLMMMLIRWSTNVLINIKKKWICWKHRPIYCMNIIERMGLILDIFSTEYTWHTLQCANKRIRPSDHGPHTWYIKLQVAHAPGMPGTFPHHRWLAIPTCMSRSLTRSFLLKSDAGKTFYMRQWTKCDGATTSDTQPRKIWQQLERFIVPIWW